MLYYITADARRIPLRNVKAQLVYADPPSSRLMNEMAEANIVDEYDYTEWTRQWLVNTIQYLASDSRLVICTWHKQRHIFERLVKTQLGFLEFEQEIIWNYNFGLYTRRKFVPSHDNILVYRLGKPPFNWESVAVKSKRLETHDPRADIRGRTPSSVWTIPRVPGNSKQRRTVHGFRRTSQPEELTTRILLAYTRPKNVVLDLFAGSGSMAIVAHRHNRTCICIDICEQYIREIKQRLMRPRKELFGD